MGLPLAGLESLVIRQADKTVATSGLAGWGSQPSRDSKTSERTARWS